MVLRPRALLKQQSLLGVEDEDGEGPVQHALDVSLKLLLDADLPVLRVNENQLFRLHKMFCLGQFVPLRSTSWTDSPGPLFCEVETVGHAFVRGRLRR